ncbi:MAG: hypothetical protein V1704_04855 [Candidatus Vogelbacteria bacterium]
MGRRGAPVKEVMSMNKFWPALAGLLDKNWVAKIDFQEIIRLYPKLRGGGLGLSYDPVSAVACERKRMVDLFGWKLAAEKLGLPSFYAERVINAAQNERGFERTRFKLIRVLKLNKPLLSYVSQ